jgi:hypothetical protein
MNDPVSLSLSLIFRDGPIGAAYWVIVGSEGNGP